MTSFDYPETRREDLTEELHGHTVADPYRWLEDPDAPETVDWVDRQNAVTDAHLADLADRDWFSARMAEIMHRPRAGVPLHKGGRYFVSRNDGHQDQDVWYVADSIEELESAGEVIIDPNTLSADGTTAVSGFTVSKDGHYLCYNRADAGSDWQDLVLLDLTTGEPVDEPPIRTKFSAAAWLPDHCSYTYVYFPPVGDSDGTETAALGGGQLRIHRVGQPASEDELLLEFPGQDRLMFWGEVSDDERWLVVSLVQGTERRNRLWLLPLSSEDGRTLVGAPVKLVDEPDAMYEFITTDETSALVLTDLDAPRGRVVRLDLETARVGGPQTPVEVIAEGEDTWLEVVPAGDHLLAVSLVDARPVLARYGLDGSPLGVVEVPGGALVGLDAHAGEDEVFVGMSSVTSPTEAFLVGAGDGQVRALDLVRGNSDFTPPEITVERRRATSADGTEVPYFLITPEGFDASTPQPTWLYGYGGFRIPVLADYRPGWAAWLAAGGALVITNLRGGGEYGADWYNQGRKADKPNVFDDFIAVGDHLVETGVTTHQQLVIHGRSNGGLLVGATMTLRPDLAAVALPGVGVLDVVRFHKFTIGAAWISDFGDPDVAEDLATILRYSPVHNVRPGTAYPATLVHTGDHDDRVVPLHSHKFAAALQHAQAGAAPVLTRIEVNTGHGMGKPTSMVAAEWADILAFAAHHTGLRVADRT